MDAGRAPLPDASPDVVAAVETIEHLENRRAFDQGIDSVGPARRWVVTTPNQLSILSKLTLLLRYEFNAFRAGSYLPHLTALLEIDLRRIAADAGWSMSRRAILDNGWIPRVRRHRPGCLPPLLHRGFADNVLIVGRKLSG